MYDKETWTDLKDVCWDANLLFDLCSCAYVFLIVLCIFRGDVLIQPEIVQLLLQMKVTYKCCALIRTIVFHIRFDNVARGKEKEREKKEKKNGGFVADCVIFLHRSNENMLGTRISHRKRTQYLKVRTYFQIFYT